MNQRQFAGLAVPVMAVTGTAVILYATQQGAGASPDSVSFVRMSDQFSRSGGAVSGQFPPLYPALLAIAARLGIAPLEASRWLNAILFGATIALGGGALMWCLPDRIWPGPIAALLLLVSPSLIGIHVMALSEPLFLFLSFACLVLAARWLEMPRSGWLLASAAVAALALLTRYVGLALVLTGALGIVWLSRESLQGSTVGLGGPEAGSFRRRIGAALIWSAIAFSPLFVWLSLTGTDTNRTVDLHPPGVTALRQGLASASNWFQVPQSASGAVDLLLWGSLAAWMLIVAYWRPRTPHPVDPVPAFLKLVALFAAAYVVVLALSLTFFDANTPLDHRILSPILVSGILWVAYLASETVRVIPMSPVLSAGAFGVLIALLCALCVRQLVGDVSRQHRDGIGFNSVAWRQSETLRLVRSLPPDVTLYSNAPEPIYLMAGRDAQSFPRPQNAMSGRDNGNYPAEMGAMTSVLRAGDGVAVYLRTLPMRAVPSETELLADPDVSLLAETADGAIYGARTSEGFRQESK